MQDVLELETRRKIHDLIKQNPGIHLSKISQILKMRTSLVEYHLLFLEKHEIISPDKETGYKRYYLKGQIGVKDKKYLFILRQKTVLEIILYLLKNDVSLHKVILENVKVSPSTLSYHLNKLIKNDIIELNRYGENKGYR
ncbi:winged helix-turn-helix transcriptional regulator, partial [Thermoplasmatota archaeon]